MYCDDPNAAPPTLYDRRNVKGRFIRWMNEIAYPTAVDQRRYTQQNDLIDYSDDLHVPWSVQWQGLHTFTEDAAAIDLDNLPAARLPGADARLRAAWNTGGGRSFVDFDIGAGGVASLPPTNLVELTLLTTPDAVVFDGVQARFPIGAARKSSQSLALSMVPAERWSPGSWTPTLTDRVTMTNAGEQFLQVPSFARSVRWSVLNTGTVLGSPTVRWEYWQLVTALADIDEPDIPYDQQVAVPGGVCGLKISPDPSASVTNRVLVVWELAI